VAEKEAVDAALLREKIALGRVVILPISTIKI
jgi:hypothetical protein